MGQKVNPIGLRLGINRTWESIWYAKKNQYGKLLIEDYKIREYIKKNIVNSGVSQVVIERTSKKCIVSIHTSRPGFVIGKKGSDIDKIKKKLSPGDVVFLYGEIGVGKTTFARLLINSFENEKKLKKESEKENRKQ
mgnify:CR=1 FL=1